MCPPHWMGIGQGTTVLIPSGRLALVPLHTDGRQLSRPARGSRFQRAPPVHPSPSSHKLTDSGAGQREDVQMCRFGEGIAGLGG